MADNYSKQLYDQLNSIDPSYGKDVSFDKFQSSIKDKNYATKVYDQLSAIDPSYKKDVSFDKFYSSVVPLEEKGFFSKAWENVTSGQGIFGKREGTPIKQEYKPQPSLLGQWIDSFSPTEKEKKQVTTGLQTLPPQTKQPKLSPLEQQQKKVDDVVNPFKEFRKLVPDTELLYGPNGPITSDSLNVGTDVGRFYSIDQKVLQVQEGDKIFETKVADLKPNPYLSDYATLSESVSIFNKQKDQQVQQLLAEQKKKLSVPYSKYASTGELKVSKSIRDEIGAINKEYNQKIQDVEKAYQNLKENVFDPLNTQITNAEQLKYRGIKGESLDEETKSLENSKVFTKNLNAQDKQARLRDAASSTIKSDVLGQDPNKLDEEYTKYDNPELAGNFVTRSPLQKESKEYRGTVEQLAINRDITEGYTERRNSIAKALEEGKTKLQEDLQNNVYSKGYKITDLTPESQKRIQEQEAGFKKLENLIKLYDENINLSKQREGILLNDVGSFTELINYKAEQDKINRLYIESPVTTFAYSFPREFGMKIASFGETASTLNILAQKKLGNISDVDADFYLKTIPEVSDRKVYVQKLVEDKETGQMVYKNLKDLESVSIFNEKGEYKPLGSWVENWDALGYQMLNTTAESAIIGFSGLAVRKGLYAAGRAATGRLATEMGILEAIDASTVGLSNINKAKLLGLQGLKKSATWTADVTSMLPATTLLYSPETIKGEIDKGLSVEDVVLTSSLRLLAETASENLFFDDVKFVDNLLKSGTVKNFTELSRSEAYRILMDKVSIATAGRGLSELEFKTLFTGQGLKKLLTKENYEYLVKRALPQKAKSLGAGIAYGVESSALESGEEVSTNAFNALIDGWRQSEDPKYKADQEFTFENQVNTVIQTMSSMLLLGGKAGYQQAKEKASERRYNVDLAAYNVAITPNIFKENLYNQYLQSQKTDNPMSNDELSLRMKEIDRIAEVYNSLGFSEENTKQNIKTQLEKLTEGKTEVDDVLKNQLLKEAEREVRNTEFQAFRDGLTKSQLENQFLTAKTDKEKEKIAEEIDKTFEKIEQLKQQRTEQNDSFIQLQKQLSEKQYDEQRLMLSKAVQNVDTYVDSFETLNEIDEQLEILNSYEDVTDETIKDYATVLSTALKNKQYELLEQGETRLTPEQIAEKQQFDLNNFSEAENNVIQSLGIKPEEISKKDGKIIYSYEGQPIEFDNFKGLYSFQQKKYQEKQEQIIKAERERAENEQIVELQKISDFPLYKTTTGKFGIDIPNEEPIEFDSIEDLEDYILNPKPAEDVQQDDLILYEDEVENEYNVYKQGKKKPLSKERWLKTKAAQKSLAPLKQKYGIIDDTTIIEDDTLAVTFVPLKTEMSENEVSQINNTANIEHLSVPGITYENTRLVSAPYLISYQSRSFTERVEIDEDTGNRYVIEESVNELNKEFEFIHSPKFAEGQEFTINIKPFETSGFTEAEKETLRNNTKYLIEQGISQEEINRDLANDEMFREIQIFDKEGRYVGAVHSLSYIRPDRVVPTLTDEKGNIIPNLANNYKDLKKLRDKLLTAFKEGKNVKLVFTAKSPGWLSIRANGENKTVGEAFTNPESLGAITVLSKTSTLRISGKETVNQGMQGSTVIPIITPNGDYFTLTLNKTKLHKLQVDNVLNAIQLHALYNKLIRIPSTDLTDDDIKALKNINDLAENIQNATQHDIRKPDGVKNYIQLFVNANSKTSDYYTSAEKESLQDIPFMDIDTDSNGALRITFSNQRIFSASDPNLKPGEKAELKAKGIYRYTLQDLMEGVDFSILREHLQNRTINHNTELVKSNKKFALPYLKKTNLPSNPYIPYPETELNYEGLTSSYNNYKDFVISTSLTPVIETKLEDGTFSYFQQPNLAFTPDITEQKPEEPPVTEEEPEVTPTPEEQPEAPVSDKKADIERRRQEAIASITSDKLGQNFLTYMADAFGTKEDESDFEHFTSTSEEDIKKQIKAKYDAELDALKGKKEEEEKEVTPEVIVSNQVADQITIENNIGNDETTFDEGLKQLEEFFGQEDIESKKGEKDLKLESKYFAEGKETTSTEVLNKIAKSNHPLAPLAKKLLEFDPKVKIELVDGSIDGKYSGRYTLKDNKIQIAKNARFRGLGSEVTLLHEIIHAQTVLYISNNPESQLVEDLQAALDKIREHKKDYPEDSYAFKDIYELVVGVFTDASAIKFLQSIPSTKPKYKNLFVELFEYIKNLFKFNNQESSMYDQVFAIGTNIISSQKEYLDLLQDISELQKEALEFEDLEKITEKEELLVKPSIKYQLPQNREIEEFVASEKTIRDLAARMSDRIGMSFEIESDRTKEYKGKIENGKAYINLAYATLDTPIHEILGHPIIRAIKNRNKTFFDIIVKKTSAGYQIRYTSKEGISDMIVNSKIYKTEEEANKEANLLRGQGNPQLYQNLLKELETGKGKEVLDRIKRDYTNKTDEYDYSKGEKISDEEYNNIKANEIKTGSDEYLERDFFEKRIDDKVYTIQKGKDSNPNSARVYTLPTYSLEEQQEEAIVELLGLMTAEKLDNVKDGKLISLLKRLLKEMKQFVRSLLNQKEVEIDKLPDNMTLGDIANLLAYSNNKLILPGNEVIYTTPDNQTFKTYQEASNHISELAKSVKDVDLSDIKAGGNQEIPEDLKWEFENEGKTYKELIKNKQWKISDNTGKTQIVGNQNYKGDNGGFYWDGENYYHKNYLTDKKIIIPYDEFLQLFSEIRQFGINKDKFYQDRIIEISDYDKSRANPLKAFIEKNKEYEQSKEIIEEWKKVNNIQYNPEEIYSRGQEFSSVVGAYSSFDVNLMMQNLLQHIEDNEKAGGKFAISAYTKPIDKKIVHLEGGGGKIKFKIYPQSNDILWAANTDVFSGSVWDASEKVSKDKKSELLGVSYTKYPSLQNVNTVQPNLANIVDDLAHHHNELGIVLTGNNFRLEYDEDIPYQTKKIIDSINKILDQKYGKVVKPEINNLFKYGSEPLKVGTEVIYNGRRLVITKIYEDGIYKKYDLNGGLEKGLIANQFKQVLINPTGIQPTQTNDTLKESIESVKNKISDINFETFKLFDYPNNKVGDIIVVKNKKFKLVDIIESGFSSTKYFHAQEVEKKEYISQALINTKIAALKEVAKKYPRSLIRSEVKIIKSDPFDFGPEDGGISGMFMDDLPFQKIPTFVKSKENITFTSQKDLENLPDGKPC